MPLVAPTRPASTQSWPGSPEAAAAAAGGERGGRPPFSRRQVWPGPCRTGPGSRLCCSRVHRRRPSRPPPPCADVPALARPCDEKRLRGGGGQGVGTFYTDPQIHSFDGRGFGAGNLGQVRAPRAGPPAFSSRLGRPASLFRAFPGPGCRLRRRQAGPGPRAGNPSGGRPLRASTPPSCRHRLRGSARAFPGPFPVTFRASSFSESVRVGARRRASAASSAPTAATPSAASSASPAPRRPRAGRA